MRSRNRISLIIKIEAQTRIVSLPAILSQGGDCLSEGANNQSPKEKPSSPQKKMTLR